MSLLTSKYYFLDLCHQLAEVFAFFAPQFVQLWKNDFLRV